MSYDRQTNISHAQHLAGAFHRLSHGDQNPPRPWAYLSGLGIAQVSELAFLQVAGFTDQAGFDIVMDDGSKYRVMVSRV